MEESHRHQTGCSTPCPPPSVQATLGPHRPERRRTTRNFWFPADDSFALPSTDENGVELSCCGVDAAGYGNPGCATASTPTEGESQSCAAGTKTGVVLACDTDHRTLPPFPPRHCLPRPVRR